MSALALVFCIGDGTNIIIICLPDASEKLLLIFIRERLGLDMATNAGGLVYSQQEDEEWMTEIGRAPRIPVFCIDVDIYFNTGVGIFVGDGTSIIITCLPDASWKFILILLMECWGET